MTRSRPELIRFWFIRPLLFGLIGLGIAAMMTPAIAQTGDGYRQRLLVLKSGRIVEGEMTISGDSFLVRAPRGEMSVPMSQVRFEAADRRDAHDKLSQTLPERTPDTLLVLARWAIDQELYAEAATDLREALILVPNHAEARRMLVRLESLIETRAGRNMTGTPVARRSPHDALAHSDVHGASLLGLSRQSVSTFRRNVQPLMIRKCARCHGPRSESKFRLELITFNSSGGSRITQQNLARTLPYLERTAEHRSLGDAIAGDADHPANLFLGPAGRTQYRILSHWIARVRTERAAVAPKNRSEPLRRASFSADRPLTLPTPPAVQPASFFGDPPGRPNDVNTPSPVPLPPSPLDDPILRQTLKEERPDAFDPDEFNRMTRP